MSESRRHERRSLGLRCWVSKNVHNEPLAYGDDYDPHIRGLLDGLLADASNAGIEKEEPDLRSATLRTMLRLLSSRFSI
jgi:hypothetical protein